MGNCIDLILDDSDYSSRSSVASSPFFRFFKWNRVNPSFIQAALDENKDSTSSHHLPSGLWEIVVDGETKRSVISALTMDESLARLGNVRNGYDLPIMMQRSQHLVPDKSVRMTAATIDESDRAHGLIDRSADEADSPCSKDDSSDPKITTEAIVSYLKTVTAQNPRISSLLSELHRIEESKEETRPASPNRSIPSSPCDRRRNEVLSCLREEFRKSLTTSPNE